MTSTAVPDFVLIPPSAEVSATLPPMSAPLDPIAAAARAEERFARVVAGYLIRAVIFAMVVVGLVAGTAAEPQGFGLLWIAGVTMVGSATIDWLVRVVTREPHE